MFYLTFTNMNFNCWSAENFEFEFFSINCFLSSLTFRAYTEVIWVLTQTLAVSQLIACPSCLKKVKAISSKVL